MWLCFRAVLFRMVPKLIACSNRHYKGFRAVLFRMVPKLFSLADDRDSGFRAVLFRMVPKKATHSLSSFLAIPLHIAHSLIAKENG